MAIILMQKMEKCLEKSRSQRRLTVQVIVDVIIWLAVALPVLFLFTAGKPVVRGFFCDDNSIKYPYKVNTISTTVLVVGGVGISILVVVSVEVLNCIDRRCRRTCQSVEDFFYCVKGYAVFLLGFVISQLVVEVTKNKMGFLRPNFYDVCRPQFNTSQCPGYITEYQCTETSDHDEDEIRDSRQSFPSGHAAFSMYIAVYFCIYIERRLEISFSRSLKLMLQLALLFVSLLCGLGRISDNKHHPSDVLAGFFLGIFVAAAVYKTIGRKVLTSESTTYSNGQINNTNICCTCANTPETQTPAPLLTNEFMQGGIGNGITPTVILKDIPYNVRRHMSTPITPSDRPVDI